MAKDQTLEDRVEALASALREQSPEAAEALLQRLGRSVRESGIAEVERMSGLHLAVASSGMLSGTDTSGKRVRVSRQTSLVVQPVTLADETVADRDDGLVAAQPFAASAVLVRLANDGKAAVRLQVDPTGIQRNWARWGAMRIVARGNDGRPVVLQAQPTEIEIRAGAAIELFGVGYAPRLSAERIFGPPSAGPAEG